MSAAAAGLAALALLLWPGRPARVRQRLRVLTRPAAAPRVAPALPAVPVPVLIGAVALLAGGTAAAAATVLVGVLAAACTALGARALLARRAASGSQLRVRALAEALGVLAAEIRAGRSTAVAGGTAVAACPDPAVAEALATQLRRPARGAPAPHEPDDDAARALVQVGAAVRLSERTGCSLAVVVTALEDDLRARLQAAHDLRSAVAGPRASATVLAGLPVLGLAMGAGVGADPWAVLTTTPVGQALLVAGVGLEAAGITWSGRLVARAVRS